MSARLGGSQISSLLESVPGIASVLRSPVADAIVNMVRAGAGLDRFDKAMAKELVQYAVRRGLLPAAEGDELLAEVETVVGKGRRAKRPTAQTKVARKKSKAKTAKKPAKKAVKKAKAAKKSSKAASKKAAPKSTKRATKPAKKAAKRRH